MRLQWVSLSALLTLQSNAVLLGANVISKREQVPLLASQREVTKRIAIVGGGTAGVTTLKTLLGDLPSETTRNWEVVVFEQRRGVGGVWLPDLEPPNPPELPDTPLYPRLKTNTPHPTMTIPNFPFRPLTYLYPHHPHVLQYHADIVSHWNLSSYFRFNHEVLQTRWLGTSEVGYWQLDILDRVHNDTVHADFDHLIVANGHYHYPYEPDFEGREAWLETSNDRRVFHSIFYRDPEDYAGRNVLIVGGGASGRDIAQQIGAFANSTTISQKSKSLNNMTFPPLPDAVFKPRITRFSAHSIVFSDDSELAYIDTVILATGYNYHIPFLTAGGHLDEISTNITLNPTHPDTLAASASKHLVTNRRYIRPLFAHTLSLDTAYPLGALYFIGLPIAVANAISDTAAALFTAHTIANASLLSSRDEFWQDLLEQEKKVAQVGSPWYVGHRQVVTEVLDPGTNQDRLVAYLQDRGVGQDDDSNGSQGSGGGIIPPKGENFTAEWRIMGRVHNDVLRKGWDGVEEGGRETIRRWLEGVETEEEWADLMRNVIRWEQKHEEGLAYSY